MPFQIIYLFKRYPSAYAFRVKGKKNAILGDTYPVEVLPSPEPHKFQPCLELHLLQGLFQLQTLAEHQSFLQSTTIIDKRSITLES